MQIDLKLEINGNLGITTSSLNAFLLLATDVNYVCLVTFDFFFIYTFDEKQEN